MYYFKKKRPKYLGKNIKMQNLFPTVASGFQLASLAGLPSAAVS